MKKTINIDSAYRFSIPDMFLSQLGIQEEDVICFYIDNDVAHIRKLDTHACTFCGSEEEVIPFDDFYGCVHCRIQSSTYADIVNKAYSKQRVYPQKRITLPFKIRQRLPRKTFAKETIELELVENELVIHFVNPRQK